MHRRTHTQTRTAPAFGFCSARCTWVLTGVGWGARCHRSWHSFVNRDNQHLVSQEAIAFLDQYAPPCPEVERASQGRGRACDKERASEEREGGGGFLCCGLLALSEVWRNEVFSACVTGCRDSRGWLGCFVPPLRPQDTHHADRGAEAPLLRAGQGQRAPTRHVLGRSPEART
eukprot:3502009-Rhodomonas_salina.1